MTIHLKSTAQVAKTFAIKRVLTDAEKQTMQAVKDKGLELHDLIESIGASRELSLAKTKTEEAVMWAVKHLTR